jgi:hypothetical protein
MEPEGTTEDEFAMRLISCGLQDWEAPGASQFESDYRR